MLSDFYRVRVEFKTCASFANAIMALGLEGSLILPYPPLVTSQHFLFCQVSHRADMCTRWRRLIRKLCDTAGLHIPSQTHGTPFGAWLYQAQDCSRIKIG